VWTLEQNDLKPRFLIHDNDGKFTKTHDTVFQSEHIHIIPTPFQAPNAKALAELVGQAFKLVRANQRSSGAAGFPALPVMDVNVPGKPLLTDGTLDADFTIAGLDDEDEQPNTNIELE